MAPTLAPEALEGAGILPIWSASLAIFGPLDILSLALTCGPCATTSRYTVGWGGLSQASLTIVGAGVTRSVPVCLSSPMASPSGAIWGTGGAVALSCSCHGSHQLGYLIPQLCSALNRFSGHGWPSPYHATGFFIFTLHFASSNHELGISGPRIAIEISYWISGMLMDPMEETIFEMLLHLLISYPLGAMQPDLAEGPCQPCGKGRDILMVACITS